MPDVAELKLLRRMEVDVLERLEQFLVLHPELSDASKEPDPLTLEDIQRLAYYHKRIAELFQGVPTQGRDPGRSDPGRVDRTSNTP